MSSNELETIYDNAAGTISLRLKKIDGVRKVLDALRTRVLSENKNPLENRSLIIEPVMLSQQLRVPRRAVEAVVEELRRFNLVHLWARAICPVVNADDDNVIVETDNSKVFKDALQESCPHCGQYHSELDWSSIETFYAVNVNDEPDPFDIRRFFISPKRLAFSSGSANPPPPRVSLWERAKRFFALGHGCPSVRSRQ